MKRTIIQLRKLFLGLSLPLRIVVVVGTVLVVTVILTLLISALTTKPEAKSEVVSGSAPTFSAVLPTGKTISDLGGWQTLTPPNSDPAYVFTDTINSVPISVSQQVLPAAFKKNLSQSIAELAKSYSATKELDASGIKVYIGTSAKGPQSVIFTMNDLLVLIKSQARVEDDAWVSYISKLSS